MADDPPREVYVVTIPRMGFDGGRIEGPFPAGHPRVIGPLQQREVLVDGPIVGWTAAAA